MSTYTELVNRAEAAALAAEQSAQTTTTNKTTVQGYLSRIEGIVANTATISDPAITVNPSTGIVTATCNATTGNVLQNTTKTGTLVLANVPNINLNPAIIKDGETILGVLGTYQGAGSGPSIPSNGLVFYTPLSSAASQAVTGQTLTVSGNVTFETQSGITAAAFDGTGYISFSDTGLPDNDDARTISLWIRQNDTGDIYLAWNYGTGEGDYDLGLFVDSRNGNGTIKTGTTFTDFFIPEISSFEYWRHILLRYNGSLVDVFVDGALIGSIEITLETELSGTAYIGCYSPDVYQWCGHIAAVRVYNRALTREEIQILASEFHPSDELIG